MKHITTTILGLLVIGVIALGVATAGDDFHSADSTVNSAGALVVTFDERGLGSGRHRLHAHGRRYRHLRLHQQGGKTTLRRPTKRP